ncbi:MAG: hypothetical protein WC707_05745 [Candidatus Babeliaceae bacterium]|jgi:hypothetical protein
MKNFRLWAIILLLCASSISVAAIRIVCTVALIPYDYETRKLQYIRTLKKLREFGYEPYVVESCASGPTFLDDYCDHVCYTHNNNSSITNKGVNEGISLMIGFQHFNFDPDDMIIKLTGRYCLETDEFIRLVEQNPSADAIVKSWLADNIYTGVFAMRLKYLSEALSNINFEEMIKKSISFETQCGLQILKMHNNGAKIIYLEELYDYLPVCTPWYIRNFGYWEWA